MTLEDIGAVKTFLQGRPGSRAESANHVPFIVGQGVAVFIVFASETFVMIRTIGDGALLWSF